MDASFDSALHGAAGQERQACAYTVSLQAQSTHRLTLDLL